MSILIDDLFKSCNGKSNIYIGNNEWRFKKPKVKSNIFNRIKDAYRVLTNKSFAVHYYENN